MNEEIMKINCLITFFCRCRIKTRRKKSLVNARLICDNRLFLIFVFLCYLFSIESKRKRKVRVQQLVEWHEYRYIYIYFIVNEWISKKKNQISSLLLVVVLLDRGSIDVIKLIVVFIYIRWHTNELSSCATSFSRCKHRIRLAVEGQTM